MPSELRFARTCYDHLAGALAVTLHDLLITGDDGAPALVPAARAALALLGVSEARPAGGRRPRLRDCLDWSERRPHLAGALGAALLTSLLDRGWLVRRRTPRAVRLTGPAPARSPWHSGRTRAGRPRPGSMGSAAEPVRRTGVTEPAGGTISAGNPVQRSDGGRCPMSLKLTSGAGWPVR